jgi:hypothetical protein
MSAFLTKLDASLVNEEINTQQYSIIDNKIEDRLYLHIHLAKIHITKINTIAITTFS